MGGVRFSAKSGGGSGSNRGSQPARGDENAEDLRILLGDCTARLRELPDESVDCVITSPPYFRCQIFPGATTIFGGDLHCAHDWEKRQFTRKHYLNAPHTVESGTCRKCGAQLVMLGWEDRRRRRSVLDHPVDGGIVRAPPNWLTVLALRRQIEIMLVEPEQSLPGTAKCRERALMRAKAAHSMMQHDRSTPAAIRLQEC